MLVRFSPGDVSMPECREVVERAIHSLLSGITPDQMKEARDEWQSLPLKFVLQLTKGKPNANVYLDSHSDRFFHFYLPTIMGLNK
jgi:hypothetical protein